MVSIEQLSDIVADIAGLLGMETEHVGGPQGVRGRSSHNALLLPTTGFAPEPPLEMGLIPTYEWFEAQVRSSGTVSVSL